MSDLLIELSKVLSTFALAFFSFWGSIPAGLALGLSPLVVILTSTLGYVSGVGIVAFAGGRLRAWVDRRFGSRAALDPNSRLYRIWDRYGMIGLGALAPLTVGAQIGAAIGMALNAPPFRLFVIMSVAAFVWSIGLTAAFLLGVAVVT